MLKCKEGVTYTSYADGEKAGTKIAKDIKGYSGVISELKNDIEFLSNRWIRREV